MAKAVSMGAVQINAAAHLAFLTLALSTKVYADFLLNDLSETLLALLHSEISAWVGDHLSAPVSWLKALRHTAPHAW